MVLCAKFGGSRGWAAASTRRTWRRISDSTRSPYASRGGVNAESGVVLCERARGRATREGTAVTDADRTSSPSGGPETPGRPSVTEKRQVLGTVVGLWLDSDKLLIHLADGRVIETVCAAEIAQSVEVGDEVLVYFDAQDMILGWLLPAVNAGVNLRHSEAT